MKSNFEKCSIDDSLMGKCRLSKNDILMFNPPARERNTTRKDRNEINLGGRVRGGRAKFATDEVSADFKI